MAKAKKPAARPAKVTAKAKAKKPAAKAKAKPKAAKVKAKPVSKATAKPIAKAKPATKAKPVAKAKPGFTMGRNPMTGEAVYIPKAAKPAKAATPADPTPADPPAGDDVLRGVALTDAALAIRSKAETLEGMSAEEIAGIDFAGKPLSPSLEHWLSRDRAMFTLGSPISLVEMLANEVDEFAPAFVDLGKYLTEPVVLFEGWGADSRRFLYLGATDEHGEYPVFTIDIDDTPFACLNGPVDVWLAQHAGAIADEQYYGALPAAYEPARAALAKTCFGGNLSFVDGQFWKTLEG